ncbi:Uncharacterized protein Adt_05535 [Abeliophyllum distichum]|uniref:Putative plant transposon protein domain-containing protein n=1 Tax=Abeliophyllum distichum TaxID=126358 RepID=A0ABD1V4C4_9LAMI
MSRMKMSAKRSSRERPPSSSSSEEEDPQIKRIDRCPVLLGKSVDLASFTFDDPFFHIEDLFVGMGWIGILTLDDKLYPSIVKDFYKKMTFSPEKKITCLLRNKRVKITRDLIRSLLRLEDGGVHLYTTKTISHTEEYNPVEACHRIIGKHFDTPARLSTNQLTLTCRVLHNIIALIIVPRKGHHDKVNHYDVFLLDSILLGRKLNFPYIMLQPMNFVLRGTRPKALPYSMILTKVFEHFGVSVHDSVVLLPKATDTINISTLKRMKIFKEDGQWVAKSKGFDDESGPSTLPFEGGEEMDEDEDEPPSRPRSIGRRPPPSASLSPRITIIYSMVGSTLSPRRLKACNHCSTKCLHPTKHFLIISAPDFLRLLHRRSSLFTFCYLFLCF